MAKNTKRRLDSKRRVLRKGESEREDGFFIYRWTDSSGKRHSVLAKTLEELREKEEDLAKDKSDGIRADANCVTLNDIYQLWKTVKRGLRDNTFRNYIYLYETYVAPDFGRNKIGKLKKSDVRRFYIHLLEERNLKVPTVDCVHTVLHQVLNIALDDGYIRTNVSDNALTEVKRSKNLESEHRSALTVEEQELFMGFLKDEKSPYHRWWSVFATLVGTGLRVGELAALNWDDIDFEEGMIHVRHTLVYYDHGNGKGCHYEIHTPKTEAGERRIPMLDEVREALLAERQYHEDAGIQCVVTIGGLSDFVFLNRYGSVFISHL